MWSGLSNEDEKQTGLYGLLSKLLHYLNIGSPQVLDKPAISHFASSIMMKLAANSANKGGNKVARSGRKI